MRRIKKFTAWILCLALCAGLLPAHALIPAENWSWGTLSTQTESSVAPNAVYRTLNAETSAGPQKVHLLEFDPKNPLLQLRAGKSRGNVYGVQTVLGITNEMDNDFPGQVVAGINGDYFDLGVGVPFGIFMDEGKLLSSPQRYSSTFGIKNDGTPFVLTHGTIMDQILVIGERRIGLSGLNNRIKEADCLMMYSSDYGASTRVKEESLEVVCDVLKGEPRHGETIYLRVSAIYADIGNTAINPGQVVFSATGTRREDISALVVGDEISAYFNFTQFWQDVKFAVGGNYTLLKDGAVQDVSDGARNPRTMVGYKADGSVVMCTLDGRQSGFAAGATLKQAATVMRDIGCIGALNLDGGGSTTFVLRPAGSVKRKVVNSPSEGSQRQVANALVLINTAEKHPTPTQLFLNATDRKLLAGGKYSFSVVGAMDPSYQPHNIPQEIIWSADSECAVIDESGNLSALSAGSVSITAQAGDAIGTAQAQVLEQLDSITSEYKDLILEPKEEKTLSVTLLAGGMPVEHTNELLEWSVDEKIGSLVSPGVIRAGEKYAQGKVRVTYKGVTHEISVTVNGEKEIEFDDLSAHLWAQEAVYRLAKQGIIRGVSETSFAPQNSIKRADFILLLIRMMGVDTAEKPTENFADVPESAYYYNELGWAKILGIANGISETEFAPERLITREEMFTLMWRVMKNNNHIAEDQPLTLLDSYADSGAISGYAKQAIATMSGLSLVKGDSKSCVNPKSPATRAESAVFIDRVNTMINPLPAAEEEAVQPSDEEVNQNGEETPQA